jgi:hypothetical protein
VSADTSPLVAVLNGMFYANAPSQPIDWAAYMKIREAFPWSWTIPTQLGDSFRGSPVMAPSKEFFTNFEPVLGQPWSFVAGKVFEAPYEAVVGAEAARLHGLKVGSELVLAHGVGTASGEAAHEHEDHPVEVVGILAPTGSAHDRAIFTSLETGWCVHAEESRLKEAAAANPGEDDHGHLHVDPEDLRDSEKLITGILLRVPTRPGEQVSSALPVAFDLLRRQFPFTVAQPAQQVQRGPFGRQKGPGIRLDLGQHRAGLEGIAVAPLQVHGRPGVHGQHGQPHAVDAGQNAGLARREHGPHPRTFRDTGLCRHIARTAEILGQGHAHNGFDQEVGEHGIQNSSARVRCT